MKNNIKQIVCKISRMNISLPKPIQSIGRKFAKMIVMSVCLSVAIVILISWGMASKHVRIYHDATMHIQATIPYLPELSEFLLCTSSQALCKFAMKRLNYSELSLTRYSTPSQVRFYAGTFYRPILFVYSNVHDTVSLLYSADLYVACLSIRGYDKTEKPVGHRYSKWWLLSADEHLSIQVMTRQEVISLISVLENMPEKDFRKLSFPTFDIGFYKYYMSRQDVIDILKDHLKPDAFRDG